MQWPFCHISFPLPLLITSVPCPSQDIWPLPFQEFFLQRKPPVLKPLTLPPELSVRQALDRVLRLPAVASKRYLTNKVVLVPRMAALAFCTVPCHSSCLSHPLGFPRLWE